MLAEVLKYFPQLSDFQKEQFKILYSLYEFWNRQINVISRKDMENFYIHHVLHSLAIAKIVSFVSGTTILDAGTGGGFPGIPLSILFPSSGFTLIDSIEKKIKVVREVSSELKLSNATPVRSRLEDHYEKYDFVVSRAVTKFADFVRLTSKNIKPEGRNTMFNGIIYLKGGDLTVELKGFEKEIKVFDIKEFFSETFFETKKIVYLPLLKK